MRNPFIANTSHHGPITVRQLVELVSTPEWPKGLDTFVKIGDVEGNNPTASEVFLSWHRPEDIVLSIDPNSGDPSYGEEEDAP